MPVTREEQEAATRALTPTPDRDRFWADAIRAAVPGFGELTCADGVLLTEYCMIGCPSNALRRLMAQAEHREIPAAE